MSLPQVGVAIDQEQVAIAAPMTPVDSMPGQLLLAFGQKECGVSCVRRVARLAAAPGADLQVIPGATGRLRVVRRAQFEP